MTDLKSETRNFDAEVGKVLKLMINALYTNKDTCIRELISNASDACEKLRYLSQVDSLPEIAKPKIIVKIDKDAGTLSIKDFGIGMSKEELVNDLGTIASSGTQRLLEKIAQDTRQTGEFIGQFGVGFYSIFMIADQVDVKTRRVGQNQSYLWTSTGSDSYTISESNEQYEGTEVIAHIKKEEVHYLDGGYIKNIILKYSNNISSPIFLQEFDANDGTAPAQLNSAKALWALNKSDISQEEYNSFYKSVFYASDIPWKILHNKNEGSGSFISLIFIPTERTFDLFASERKRRIKLYVKRVFVAEGEIDLIPYYLRFLRGVVDTDSLSLNISRETIQNSAVLVTIRRVIVARVLKELGQSLKSSFDEYKTFWNNFGSVLKEGLCEDSSNTDTLLNLCLFYSAKNNGYITLDQYLLNAQSEQKSIYYVTGESLEGLLNSPQTEGFLKQGLDVLLMTDSVDSFWVGIVSGYRDFPFVSVAKAGIDIANISHNAEKANNVDSHKHQSDSLCKYFRECLGSLVKDVQISKKLVASPVCLVIEDGSMDARMERFLLAQKHISELSAKVMEINFNHPIIQGINARFQQGICNDDTRDIVRILFDQALLTEGDSIPDVSEFCQRVYKLIMNKMEKS